MDNIKVSVLVPIYKHKANVVAQCLDSIYKQTLSHIEIILVDNEASEENLSLINEYLKKDNRFKVIHIEKNSGYGPAMNVGLKAAQGEYIGIVESDDWIEPDMYEKLYNQAKLHDADIVKCDFYLYDSYANPSSVPYPHGTACLQNIYKEDTVFKVQDAPLILAYHSSLWASLYKANFIKNIKFQECEGAAYVDFPFMFEALTSANRIILNYSKFNHYRMEANQDSSTKKPGKGVMKILDQITYVKNFLKEKNIFLECAEGFYYHASKCCAGFFYGPIEEDYKEVFYDGMVEFYKDFPSDFKFLYFEKNLKDFVIKICNNEKDSLLGATIKTKLTLKMRIKKFFSNLFNRI